MIGNPPKGTTVEVQGYRTKFGWRQMSLPESLIIPPYRWVSGCHSVPSYQVREKRRPFAVYTIRSENRGYRLFGRIVEISAGQLVFLTPAQKAASLCWCQLVLPPLWC